MVLIVDTVQDLDGAIPVTCGVLVAFLWSCARYESPSRLS